MSEQTLKSFWSQNDWGKLSSCWCDPSASDDVAATHRVRQFRALSQQMPVSIFDCMVCSLIDIAIFWGDADHGLLLAWCAAIWVLSGGGLFVWQRTNDETDVLACSHAARWMTATLAVSGLLFAVMLAYLFGLTDRKGQLLLTAFFAATIAHGAFHNARWPWAGCLWGIGMCVAGAVALLCFYGGTYGYLALLLVLYGISVTASVLITSRLFVKNLVAETEIERQRNVIGLLLNDFEGDASDWLWETDRYGNLSHVSVRMANAIGVPALALQGQPIMSVLIGNEGSTENTGISAFDQLNQSLRQATPFRDIEIPIATKGELRWWSLKGKPLFDAAGVIAGWRGVGSEITALVRQRQMERDLQASREEAARFASELDTARRIQLGLLPDLVAGFVGEHRFSVSAILEPAREVGGDYYECFSLDERRICFAVADVSGKGIPASLFMAMTKVLAVSMAKRSPDLGLAVSEIANELDCNNAEMLFVTAFIAVLDVESGELTFVSAGHDAPVLLRNETLARLDLGSALGPPMCAMPDYTFQAKTLQLQPGDTLCLFTDGVTEATDGRSFFGSEGLVNALSAKTSLSSVGEIARGLRDNIRNFEAEAAPADDLTIMVLRWHGNELGKEAE
jgi:serine phosphatase RsbU (regulator of sigma subunit)/PAS domain-containing protein